MSRVQEGRVIIPAPAQRLPPNPHLGGSHTHTEPASSEADSAASHAMSKSQKDFRNRLLRHHQRSFITGSASPDLQACHIVNTVRSGVDKEERRKMVENLLTEKAVNGSYRNGVSIENHQYNLDAVFNGILLDANFHLYWELYGAIYFLPPLDTLGSIEAVLLSGNQIWQLAVERDGVKAKHLLFVNLVPFTDIVWKPLILIPKAFPDAYPFMILRARSMFMNRQPEVQTYNLNGIRINEPAEPPDWDRYGTSPNTLELVNHATTSTRLAFRFVADLTPESYPSVLAMIINADSKLQHARKFASALDPEQQRQLEDYSSIVTNIVDLIFWTPTPKIDIDGGDSSLSARMVPLDSPVGHSEPQVDDTMQTDEEDSGSDTNTEKGQEATDDDGLMLSEARKLDHMIRNPYTSGKDCLDAVRLLLHGTNRYSVPHTLRG